MGKTALTSNLVVLVLAVLNGSDVHSGLIGEDLAAFSEIGVTGVQNGVQHGLVEKEVTHPLRYDDVNLREGELDLLHLALEESNLVAEAVDSNDLLSLLNDRGHVDTDHMLGTSTGSEPGNPISHRGLTTYLF